MCLAIPMKIVDIQENGLAVVSQDGMETEVDLSLIDNPKIGDYVIVHAGFALEVLDMQEAEERLKIFHEMATYNNGGPED